MVYLNAEYKCFANKDALKMLATQKGVGYSQNFEQTN